MILKKKGIWGVEPAGAELAKFIPVAGAAASHGGILAL